MIRAMNLAEEFRTPIFLMMDEVVGHMTERVEIPPAESIEITPRKLTKKSPDDYRPYETNGDLVPEMAVAGEGYKFHVTGLTHDERGYPSMTPETQDKLINRLLKKVETAKDRIIQLEEEQTEDAEVVVVSYGITMRVAERAIQMARAEGIRTGKLRLITVWPLADARIKELAGKVKALVVPELNLGQVSLEVERAAAGVCPVIPVPHAGGTVHKPEQILAAIRKGAGR
jgi:2-oxoglutarate ferredoxin oxidoreductase subunit alpha